jgi:probable DNA metabolism protein
VLAVLKEAGKVTHEICRLTGLLRFSPESGGVYTARCAPDNFILPALAEHFTLRFGETPWAIIDEKRGLCLSKTGGSEAVLVPLPTYLSGRTAAEKTRTDSWEDMWRLYHKSINNESRKNLRLQRQLMPERYQKYLTELK